MKITQAQYRVIEGALFYLYKERYDEDIRIQILPNLDGSKYGCYLAWKQYGRAAYAFAEEFGGNLVEASQIAQKLTECDIETDLIHSTKDEIWLANNPMVVNDFVKNLTGYLHMCHYQYFIEHCLDKWGYLIAEREVER